MKIENKTILITGANRGIGKALVIEALKRGVKRVYAGTRENLDYSDERVIPIILDTTNSEQIMSAVEKIKSLDILINNAGLAVYDNLTNRSDIELSLKVNLFGTYNITQAFLPLLIASKGAIVNNLSVLAIAPLPIIPSYSISKAATFSLTQSLRALLSKHGVKVHAAMIGPTDTDMNKGFDIPKASVEITAQGILDGIENDQEEIFPDPMSAMIAEGWNNSVAKAMERENAAFVTAEVA